MILDAAPLLVFFTNSKKGFYRWCKTPTMAEDLARKHFLMETVGKMKEIMPGFISNNSIYTKLDSNKQ